MNWTTYTEKLSIVSLKFKFNWITYIFICKIWHSYSDVCKENGEMGAFILVEQSYSVPSGARDGMNTRTISKGLGRTLLEPSAVLPLYVAWEDNQSQENIGNLFFPFSPYLVTISFVVQTGTLLWVTSTLGQKMKLGLFKASQTVCSFWVTTRFNVWQGCFLSYQLL